MNKDRILLILAGLLCAMLAWFFWHETQATGFSILLWLLLLALWASIGDMAHRLESTEKRLALLLQHFNIDPDTVILTSPHVRQLLDAGDKIQALKAYRKETGASLKQAKEAIEIHAGQR